MDERELPITEHLAELRSRIFRILITWILGCIAAWGFREEIFGYLIEPAIAALEPSGGKLQAIAPAEIFFTYLKCALLAGVIATAPIFFWQVWGFISPGLYSHERRLAIPFVLCSSILFMGGAIFGYSIVFPIIFKFFAGFENVYIESAWTMREVFTFCTRMILAFGIAFELPVLVFFLAAARIVSPAQLLRGFPYAVLGIFVGAAMLTPPDVISQVFLAAPLIVLYLLGVGVAYIVAPRNKAKAATIGPNP